MEPNKALETKVVEICYSRKMCAVIGVDYERLPPEDILKIRRYVIDHHYGEE